MPYQYDFGKLWGESKHFLSITEKAEVKDLYENSPLKTSQIEKDYGLCETYVSRLARIWGWRRRQK